MATTHTSCFRQILNLLFDFYYVLEIITFGNYNGLDAGPLTLLSPYILSLVNANGPTDAHVRTETWVLIALNSSGMTISYWVFVDLPLQAGQRRSAPLNRDGVVELQQHWPTDQVWQLTEYRKVTCNTSHVVKSHSCPIQVITIFDLNQNETSPKGVNFRTIWSVDSARYNYK